MDAASYKQQLLAFLDQSPTPFHAVRAMATLLDEQGFQYLPENLEWKLEPGNRYYTTRNGSSLIAFVYAENTLPDNGIRFVGAHTDSPCLKVKPNPVIVSNGCTSLGVEVYGGALLNPWFDRDLSLAGRVAFKNEQGNLRHSLVDFQMPIGVIPSLAIHLDREANASKSVNAQKDLPVILSTGNDKNFSYQDFLAEALKRNGEQCAEVLDAEMFFYDTQPSAITGLHGEFISSARLDNLLSCFVGLQALLASDGSQHALLVCNDHEEVGSASACGAQGPMLSDFLTRLISDNEQRIRCIYHSMMVSLDNAHAIHPNFADKHDSNHGPQLNSGPVIKVNASQRYASNSETQSVFRSLAKKAGYSVQDFVVRSDMACGSTIGPITAAELGIATIDVGIPQLAMHSIRELCGSSDPQVTTKILESFYNQPELRLASD